ncbi:MAG: hypothetical protein R6W69_09315 [Anaerolineales bacterium]
MSTTCTNTVSSDGKYIIHKIVGEIDARIASELNHDLVEMGRRYNINRYLTDLTECRNVDSLVDNYNYAYRDLPADPVIDPSARVALLVSPEDHSHDFVEVTCRNAGFDVTLFRERDAAVRHLLNE